MPQVNVDDGPVISFEPSEADERGSAEQIAELRVKRWLEENREALDSSNAYIEAHGLPLAKHRPY